MTDKDTLNFFARFIESQSGIAYTEVTFYQLESRLETIATQLGYPSVEILAQTARKEGIRGPMKDLLIDLATNNETSFFRDPNLFTSLSQTILPDVLNACGQRSCRIWSAASSTGQEIYSIAMLLHELLGQFPHARWELIASDISERVLAKAKSGIYSQLEIQRGLSAQRLLSYFDQVPDSGNGPSWQVKPFLRQKISFRQLNLIEPWPPNHGTFDIILCRNVLIYQDIEQKKRVLKQFTQHLHPRSWFILGGAESLIGLTDDFEQEKVSASIAYRLKASLATRAS